MLQLYLGLSARDRFFIDFECNVALYSTYVVYNVAAMIYMYTSNPELLYVYVHGIQNIYEG